MLEMFKLRHLAVGGQAKLPGHDGARTSKSSTALFACSNDENVKPQTRVFDLPRGPETIKHTSV